MKKIIAITLAILSVITISACGGKTNKIAIKEDNIRMNTDDKYTIKLAQETEETVVWKSKDESVAVVSPDGTVTAVGGGITVITARAETSFAHVGVIVDDGGEYVDENGNTIPIFNGESDITAIIVGARAGGKNEITIRPGDKHQLLAYTTPSDSKDKIVWRTNDASVVKISEKGEIEAISAGKTVIDAYAPNGVNGKLIVRVK